MSEVVFRTSAKQFYTARRQHGLCTSSPSIPVCRERVVSIQRGSDPPPACLRTKQNFFCPAVSFLTSPSETKSRSDSSTRCSGSGNPHHQECRLRNKPLYLPGSNRIRQPAQAGQTTSALRFCRSSPWKPWHRYDFSALRGPARVLLSPPAYNRESRSSHPVRGLAHPSHASPSDFAWLSSCEIWS